MRVQSSEFRAGSEKMRCGARAKIALAKDRAFVWLISDQQRNRTKQSDKQPYVYTHPSNCDRDPSMGIPILQDRCEGGGGSLESRCTTRRSSLLSVKNVSQTAAQTADSSSLRMLFSSLLC